MAVGGVTNSWLPRFFKRPRFIWATLLGLLVALGPARNRLGAFIGAWLVAYGLAWVAGRIWWHLTYPEIPPWSRPSKRRLTSRMLREDVNASVFSDRKGFLFRKRYWFVGTGCLPTPIFPEWFKTTVAAHHSQPMPVASNSERAWWWYQDRFYWENQGYSSKDVMALVPDRERRQERQLQRAHDLLSVDNNPTPQRMPIPKDVRRAVYERDGGSCVQCGSKFELQYDHILPVALGGATTVGNLQLLCSACNGEKSDSL